MAKDDDSKCANMDGSSCSSCRENIFRKVPLRYLGYANEVGESFRYQFPRFVLPSYALAFGYCSADAFTSGYNQYCEGENRDNERKEGDKNTSFFHLSEREESALACTCDTMLWQCLASVMIPGTTINVIVRLSTVIVTKIRVSSKISKWFPTFCGLGSIPLIIHPIDQAVDFILDNTTRRWMFNNEKDR